MRKIAEKVGCSHGNLYLHFEHKEALFDCLVEESFKDFEVSLRKVRESVNENDPVGLLRMLGRAYVQFGLTNASAYEFAFLLRRPGQVRIPHVTYEKMKLIVQRCIDEKLFRTMDADAGSQALWSAAHGITSLLILHPTFPWADHEKLVGQVIDAAVDGLLA